MLIAQCQQKIHITNRNKFGTEVQMTNRKELYFCSLTKICWLSYVINILLPNKGPSIFHVKLRNPKIQTNSTHTWELRNQMKSLTPSEVLRAYWLTTKWEWIIQLQQQHTVEQEVYHWWIFQLHLPIAAFESSIAPLAPYPFFPENSSLNLIFPLWIT